jgi:glucose/arabinose dehydrogenase
MRKTNALATLLVAGFLICCYTTFQTSAHSEQNDHLAGQIAAPTASELQSVISGLSSPVYVTHAHDGTNRLFILEQAGRIRVAQPGASTSTVFLDIVSKVSSGGERGLLGLAFHPQYSINGRFFVYYTRQPDGALTLSEYAVSSDPNVANANSEIVFNGNFPIPHSTNNNHNGGCLQFGPDGFLYVGTGDGGAANDPPDNAQNINVMLGKILRIDVDTPNGTIVYSSPSTNPFFGPTAGLDEIYAYGMRNPWRFSFDRLTAQLRVGDVGQGAREEIDIVTLGGNYGWRVMEGSICNPFFNGGVCTPPAGSILPIFDYEHLSGRCSITGGYSYRGLRSAVPLGSYVYADYCSGEIWQLLSGTNTLLLDTALNITSFGEDEAGEVYIVGQGGSISRLAASPPPPPCVYMISPTQQLFPPAATEGTFTVTTTSDCGWVVATNVNWITLGANRGAGTTTITFAVQDNLTTSQRTGLIHVGGQTFTVLQDSSTPPPPACSYRISPKLQNLPASGGSGSFNLTTGQGCAWEATTPDPWITITSSSAGTGNATITYTVSPNPGRARKGTIRVADQIFSVKQRG